jgi:putative membrane protein
MDLTDLAQILAGANGFFLHFVAAVVLTILFACCYVWITPYAEFQLIKAGKTAPAIAFSAAILGFALALAGVIANSVSLLDMLVWSGFTLFMQMLVFLGFRLLFVDLCRRITDDELGPALVLASFSLTSGILIAACMTV